MATVPVAGRGDEQAGQASTLPSLAQSGSAGFPAAAQKPPGSPCHPLQHHRHPPGIASLPTRGRRLHGRFPLRGLSDEDGFIQTWPCFSRVPAPVSIHPLIATG